MRFNASIYPRITKLPSSSTQPIISLDDEEKATEALMAEPRFVSAWHKQDQLQRKAELSEDPAIKQAYLVAKCEMHYLFICLVRPEKASAFWRLAREMGVRLQIE